MKLPGSVKIGALDYAIAEFASRDAASRHLYGEVLHPSQRIHVDTSHGPARSALALLHEFLHAAIEVHHIDVDDEKEEAIVRQLTASIGAAMRDSPEVFAFMLESLAPPPASTDAPAATVRVSMICGTCRLVGRFPVGAIQCGIDGCSGRLTAVKEA